MSMLERYRKKGGFVQLLNLIETSDKEKQERFLKLINAENPLWESELRKKMLTIERIMAWDSIYLREIFPRVPALQLAMVAGGLPSDKSEKFKSILTFKELKGVTEILESKTPSPAETIAGQMKLFTEIRKMIQEGCLKLETICPEMSIDDNIEEQLNSGKIKHKFEGPKSVKSDSELNCKTDDKTVSSDEIQALRKKLVALTQENHSLNNENQILKDKLEQIRKIA